MKTAPYVAVIFASRRSADLDGYAEMLAQMNELVAQQPGYLGVESVVDGQRAITISYWRDEESSLNWRAVADHIAAQRIGRERWYDEYELQVATVTRVHRFER